MEAGVRSQEATSGGAEPHEAFDALRRKVGDVSEKMLAQTLQWLESDGLVLRVSHPVVPPHVEYSLTPLGRQVAERMENLVDWIESNLGKCWPRGIKRALPGTN
jgi:DNA-binding HxlR family transcriptional regulator